MTVEVGKEAPNFTLDNQDGEKITLSDFRGKNVVLYFYPKDMTPGCTTQACDFRDNYSQFKDTNTVMLGISSDPIERNQKFIDKYDIRLPLLADKRNEVAEEYGVWKLKKMFEKECYGIERSTYIIDKDGIVQKEYRKV